MATSSATSRARDHCLPEAAVRALDELRGSRSEAAQARAAATLRAAVEERCRELSAERLVELVRELNQRVHELVRSEDAQVIADNRMTLALRDFTASGTRTMHLFLSA
jgi:hypothetical protein